ncbi:extracellular solute-binding protein (plasmid) [Rhizobium leguminosarum]
MKSSSTTSRFAVKAAIFSCAVALAAPATTLAQTEVRIVSGQASQNGNVLKDIFNGFAEKNSDVKVNFELDNRSDLDTTQKVLADIVAGTEPDAVRITGAVLRAYVDSGRAQPLDSCLSSAPELAAQLDSGLLKGFKVNGKLYAMPWYTTLPALFINDDAFKAAGLDPSRPPQTWSEVEAAAAKLSDKSANKFGVLMYMPNDYLFEAQLRSAGGQIVDAGGKPAVSSPESVAVMQFMRGLVEKGYMPAIAPSSFWGQFAALFQSGDVGMLLISSSSFPALTGKVNFHVSLAPMPIKDGGARVVTASSNGFVMLATDPEKQAATCKALLSLITPENVAKTVMATASSPHNRAAAEKADLLGDYYAKNPTLASINTQPSVGWYSLPGKSNSEFQTAFGDIQYEILTGSVTASEGLQKLATTMAGLLSSQ